jgi:hypothetical protein
LGVAVIFVQSLQVVSQFVSQVVVILVVILVCELPYWSASGFASGCYMVVGLRVVILVCGLRYIGCYIGLPYWSATFANIET